MTQGTTFTTTNDDFWSTNDSPTGTALQVKFTCKVCDTTSVKRVSPHGWSRGTVLAKCDGCDNIHKLWDHLKVFHELKGKPLFLIPPPPNSCHNIHKLWDHLKVFHELKGTPLPSSCVPCHEMIGRRCPLYRTGIAACDILLLTSAHILAECGRGGARVGVSVSKNGKASFDKRT